VAYKELTYARLTEQVMRAFREEVKTLSQLRHENVVMLVGACTDPKKLSIITEWVPRGALRDVLLNNHIKLNFNNVLKMAMDVACGMAYLHSRRIIHRDLKSHNLLVDESWTVKVADFGYAKPLSTDESTALTEVGTSGWVAPEVLDGDNGYNKSVDVFSYGVCLWEMITRGSSNPLCGLPALRYYREVEANNMPSIPAWCPAPFARLIQSCWAFRPEARPDFPAIIAGLRAIMQDKDPAAYDAIDVPCNFNPS